MELRNTIGRPRSKRIRTTILKTALELVAQDGYAALTMKRVAEVSGVGRPTLYRWWRTKGEILLEALAEQADKHASLAEAHGSVAQFLNNTFHLSYGPAGAAVVGLMTDAQHDPALHSLLQDRLITPRCSLLAELLQQKAAAQGAAFAVPLQTVVDMLFGAMWYRLLNSHAPLDEAFARQLEEAVDRLLGSRTSI